jgi:polygalacturonase
MNNHFIIDIPINFREDPIKVRDLIQEKIDLCNGLGGGTVHIPSGEYRVSTIQMKSNVTLKMDEGCILISAINPEEFIRKPLDETSNYSKLRSGVIIAFKCNNVAILGGKIIGNGEDFWIPLPEEERKTRNTSYYKAKPFRPYTLLFYKCNNVLLKDIYTEDSPCYAGWFVDCKNMSLKGITVNSNLHGLNTDGLHFSSCIDVLIEDCDLTTGDDALAIDANSSGFSQNFVIRNCVINTTIDALRIYTGLDPNLKEVKKYQEVYNVTMCNCKILNAACVVNLVAQNGKISNVRFFNMDVNIERRGTPIFMMTDNGYLENVSIRNFNVNSNGIATIIGTSTHYIKNICIRDIKMDVCPKEKPYVLEVPDPIPNYSHHHRSPCNMYIRYAKNIKIENLSVKWVNNDEFDHKISAVRLINVNDIGIKGLDAYPYGDDKTLSTISIENGENIVLENCLEKDKDKINYVSLKGKVENISIRP